MSPLSRRQFVTAGVAAGAGLVVEVEGERDNVMGLPVGEVLAALRRHATAPPGDADS